MSQQSGKALPVLTLNRAHSPLAAPDAQKCILEQSQVADFQSTLAEHGLPRLQADLVKTLQINVGKVCNQTCNHCHVDAGPERREVMSRETAAACIDALRDSDIGTLDITGGAPEMNPHFRWLVEQACALGRHVIDRCNLTILSAPGFRDLPEFLAQHQVEIIASLEPDSNSHWFTIRRELRFPPISLNSKPRIGNNYGVVTQSNSRDCTRSRTCRSAAFLMVCCNPVGMTSTCKSSSMPSTRRPLRI